MPERSWKTTARHINLRWTCPNLKRRCERSLSSCPAQTKTFCYFRHPFCVAYVLLLWFPLSSETFIYREISLSWWIWASASGFTRCTGKSLKGCSKEMRAFSRKNYPDGHKIFFFQYLARFSSLAQETRTCRQPLREGFSGVCAIWKHWAKTAGVLWPDFYLPKMPGRWCGSYSFGLGQWSGNRSLGSVSSQWAYPFLPLQAEQGYLPTRWAFGRKIGRCLVHPYQQCRKNVRWLQKFCPADQQDKVSWFIITWLFVKQNPRKNISSPHIESLCYRQICTHQGLSTAADSHGTFAQEGMQVKLTLVGNGSWGRKLFRMRKNLHLEDCVEMPGFIPHDELENFHGKIRFAGCAERHSL